MYFPFRSFQYYRKYKFLKSSGGTYDDVDDDRLRPGRILVVNHLSIENRTSAFTNIIIGLSDGNIFDRHEFEPNPLANRIYWTKSPLIVPEGFFIRVRCTGCTANDELHMYAQGILYQIEVKEDA